MTPRPSAFLTAASMIALAVLAGCSDKSGPVRADSNGSKTTNGGAEAKTKKPGRKDGPELVKVIELAPRAVEERLPCTGKIESFHGVAILSPARGEVTEVLVEDGDVVKKNDVLLRIDDREAKLNVAATKNRESDATNRKRESELALIDARDRLTQSKTEHLQAKRTLDRTRRSREQEIASDTALEDAQLAYDKAKSALDLANTAVALAELGTKKAATELESATIQRRIQERLLEDYTVRAPIAGTVSQLAVKGGEWVASQTLGTLNQNERLLCAVYNHRDLVIKLARPQKEFSLLQKGQRVEITVDTYPRDKFEGRVDLISPDIDQDTGTFTVRVRIDNKDNRLRPGMFCRASIITGTSKEALMIPKGAIVFEGDRPFAFVVREGKAVKIALEPGIEPQEGNAIEATNRAATKQPGLFAPGDFVIVEGNNKLDAGRNVKVVKE